MDNKSDKAFFPHLLGLPRHVRCQIYQAVGVLCDFGPINLVRQDHSWRVEYTLNSLSTCRTVYAEVSSIVYSTNRIFIRHNDRGNLDAIRNLSPSSLVALSDLTILLKASSCDEPDYFCEGFHDPEEYLHDTPLRLGSTDGHNIVSEWKSTVEFLGWHIQPSRLKLSIVCDAADLETAKAITEPLLCLPTLANCHIRLGRHRDEALERLAITTVNQATGYQLDQQPTSSFRFLDLPVEIQLQILERTDLISPLREIEWSTKGGYRLRHFCPKRAGIGSDEDCYEHSACQFTYCFDYARPGCFCRRYHAASSTTCKCWMPPTPLFLVCHDMRKLALRVFFSENRFIIQTEEDYMSVITCTPPRLEASVFLTDIVPTDMLQYLHFLELVFPAFTLDYLKCGSPAHCDWLKTMEYIKDKLNFSKFTLRIYMLDFLNLTLADKFRERMTKEQVLTVLHTYAHIAAPFRRLHGLKRVFVHTAWPLYWQRERYFLKNDHIAVDHTKTADDAARAAHKLEEVIMGKGYDSSALGKHTERDSQWLVSCRTFSCMLKFII